MKTRLVCLGFLAMVAGSIGCGGDQKACTLQSVYGLAITVVDDQTSEPICAASVVATDSAHVEVLKEDGCGAYSGAAERPGVYTVSVSKGSFQSTMVGPITVSFGECHVEPVRQVVRLRR